MGHELGPFEGLTISTSGHNAAEKESLGRVIQQGHGVYSKNMTKACTHLIIKGCEGPRTISEKERCEVQQVLKINMLKEHACIDG